MFFNLKHTAQALVSLSLFATITGCAHMNVTKSSKDDEGLGFRFYRPAPYLLVSAVPPEEEKEEDAQKPEAKDSETVASPAYTYSIVWLPDKKQEYRIDFKSGFGTIETKFELENGWNLTSFGQTQDSKVADVMTGIATAAGTAIAALKESKKSGNTDGSEVKLGLHRIIFNEDGMISHFEHISWQTPSNKKP